MFSYKFECIIVSTTTANAQTAPEISIDFRFSSCPPTISHCMIRITFIEVFTHYLFIDVHYIRINMLQLQLTFDSLFLAMCECLDLPPLRAYMCVPVRRHCVRSLASQLSAKHCVQDIMREYNNTCHLAFELLLPASVRYALEISLEWRVRAYCVRFCVSNAPSERLCVFDNAWKTYENRKCLSQFHPLSLNSTPVTAHICQGNSDRNTAINFIYKYLKLQ